MNRIRRGTRPSVCLIQTTTLSLPRISSDSMGSIHPDAGNASTSGFVTPALVDGLWCLDDSYGAPRSQKDNREHTPNAAFRLLGGPVSQIASSQSGKGMRVHPFITPHRDVGSNTLESPPRQDSASQAGVRAR
jgi:hypothetical protein